jgi:hypothetical protein
MPDLRQGWHAGSTSCLAVSQVVFYDLPGGRGSSWPRVYGKLDAQGRVVAIARATEGGLFAALDAKLRSEQIRFADVFVRFAGTRGYLDPDALLDMLYDLLPTLTKGDLYYFQVNGAVG